MLALVLVAGGCSRGSAGDPAASAGPAQLALAPERPAEPAGGSDVALKVLLLDDDTSWAQALRSELRLEGIPVTRIDLTGGDRAAVTASLLARQDASGAHGQFSAIIAPQASSTLLKAGEQQLLRDYQSAFAVRLVETGATDDISKEISVANVYRGPIDGATATLTGEATGGPFSYLRGTVRIDPGSDDTEAALIRNPVEVKGVRTTPLLTTTIPGTKLTGTLIRTEVRDGRERMLFSFNGNSGDEDQRVLSHGVLRWVTRDVSLSHFRSWFSVHADDVLLPDTQWSVEGKCEIGRNCPAEISTGGPAATVRMVPDDVDALVAWQQQHGIVVDLVLNGAGAAQYAQTHDGTDPLADRLVALTANLRWINHTFSHTFLGCKQILMPDDWKCVETDGRIDWVPKDTLSREIVANQRFMAKMKLQNYSTAELVTGEHSGLRKPPQQPEDNPTLADALTRAGISWVAADASDETTSRQIGSATTVPRSPIDLDYDTPTKRQVVSLYNWKNTSAADGGSGQCQTNGEPCVAPLDLDRGFDETILPMEADKIYQHMTSDDPRPHFVHQSNLTSQRLLYPILEEALRRRAETYADSVRLLNPSMSQAGQAFLDRQNWTNDQGQVSATVSGRRVRLTNDGDIAVRVPVTLPDGAELVSRETVTGPFGEAYADQRSDWVDLAPGASADFQTDAAQGFPTATNWSKAG